MHRSLCMIRRSSGPVMLGLLALAGCTGSIGEAGRGGPAAPGGENGTAGAEPPRAGEAPASWRRPPCGASPAPSTTTPSATCWASPAIRRPGFGLDEDEGGFAANTKAPHQGAAAREVPARWPRSWPAKPLTNLAGSRPARPRPDPKRNAWASSCATSASGPTAGRSPPARSSSTGPCSGWVGREATSPSGLELVVSTMLQSPNFLYRPELGDPARAGPRWAGAHPLRDGLAALVFPPEHHARPGAVRRRRGRPAGHAPPRWRPRRAG